MYFKFNMAYIFLARALIAPRHKLRVVTFKLERTIGTYWDKVKIKLAVSQALSSYEANAS